MWTLSSLPWNLGPLVQFSKYNTAAEISLGTKGRSDESLQCLVGLSGTLARGIALRSSLHAMEPKPRRSPCRCWSAAQTEHPAHSSIWNSHVTISPVRYEPLRLTDDSSMHEKLPGENHTDKPIRKWKRCFSQAATFPGVGFTITENQNSLFTAFPCGSPVS